VGIVSGHRGYDPGAVCDDGLTEAEINHNFAVEVSSLLQRRGLQVDILDEYDPRLTEYQADVLVSIHSDSCIAQTGYKVARVTDSAIPQAEDQLVACLNEQYALYTGLPQHPATITDNMTDYHAFNEIAPYTPGAIVETGFMGGDRDLLEHKPKIVARGIAAGILCFLEQNKASAP
jgi:N-acetylmuramoyl-L-alanine amidase